MQSRKKFELYTNSHPQKPALFTREGIDILNSVCWLMMDALWMFNLPKIGLLFFGIPTVFTAWALFYRERKGSGNWTNLATNCWIFMNILWMLSDTFPAHETQFLIASKVSLILGMLCVAIGARQTGSVTDAIAHYKRYKSLGDKKIRILK